MWLVALKCRFSPYFKIAIPNLGNQVVTQLEHTHTHTHVLTITPHTCTFHMPHVHIAFSRNTHTHTHDPVHTHLHHTIHVHTCMFTQSHPHTHPASNSDSTYFTAGFLDGSNGAGRHFSLSYQNITFSAPDTLQTTEQFRTITVNNNWLRCELLY